MNHDDVPDMTAETVYELSEMAEMTSPSLSVMVDFNDLLSDYGQHEAFELIGKLKDLLA